MRQQIRNVMATLVVAMMVLMVGCASDDADFKAPGGGGTETPDSGSGVGYLAVEKLMLFVDAESEDLNNDDYMVDDRTKVETTNKTVEADGSYTILIYTESVDDNGDSSYEYKCHTTYAKASTPIELPVGKYALVARSWGKDEAVAAVGDEPEYTSDIEACRFTIGADETTTITNKVVCKMANVKVSLEMAVDLLAQFDIDDKTTPLKVTLSFGDAERVYDYADIVKEKFYKYFAMPVDTNTLTLTLNGMYNIAKGDEEPSYVPVTWVQDIESVKAGQYRVIAINYANYNEGKIHIQFTVYTWAYGTSIGVDVSSSEFDTKGEAEIIDPDDFISDHGAPVVTLAGGLDIAQTYEFTPESFDDEKKSYAPAYGVVITPEVGAKVESVKLNIFSIANRDFAEALDKAEFDTKIDLWSAEDGLADGLDKYVKTTVGGANVLTFDMLYEAARAFGDFYGAYNMKLTVVDDKARESNILLKLNSTTLSMLWKGYDFGTRYEIWTDEEFTDEKMISVKFDITSMTGVTAMKIKMVSDKLTDEVLGVMDLATEMDLVTPATPAMESSLKGLGFPTGDQIKGQTAMVFDISQFMPLLALLSDPGSGEETDFVITVEDASGSLTKTLMLKRR